MLYYRLIYLTRCDRIVLMKIIALLLGKLQKTSRPRTIVDYKHDMLIKTGREQFKALVKKGLSVPIVFL